MNTRELLESKWAIVEPGANIFGGGVWNQTNDLNWAMQQVKPTGKPAGDRPEYNKEAADMLRRFIPSLSPEQAGELVRDIHDLTHQYVRELTGEFKAQGLTDKEALLKAREIAYSFQGEIAE